MKLDSRLIVELREKITECLYEWDGYDYVGDQECEIDSICTVLGDLDLVFKSGDASQSVLVENFPKNKDIGLPKEKVEL